MTKFLNGQSFWSVRLVSLTTATVVTLVFTASLSAQKPSEVSGQTPQQDNAASRAPTSPRQGWARIDGLENLQPLQKPITADQVADRLAIEDAFSRWGVAYDEGREDVIRSLFTADGYVQGAGGSYDPKGKRTTGAAAVARSAVEGWKGQGDQRRHLMGNVVILNLSADRASALAYGVVTAAANGLYLGASVIYSADLTKERDGIWRFSRFIIGVDHYTPRPP